MQAMNDAVLRLAIMCGLLGLLIGFGIAFWAADALYWRAERRKRQRVLKGGQNER